MTMKFCTKLSFIISRKVKLVEPAPPPPPPPVRNRVKPVYTGRALIQHISSTFLSCEIKDSTDFTGFYFFLWQLR